MHAACTGRPQALHNLRSALAAQRGGTPDAILPPPLQRAVLRGEAVAGALQLLLQVFDAERFDDDCADIALEQVRLLLGAGVCSPASFMGKSYVHLVCLACLASPACMLCTDTCVHAQPILCLQDLCAKYDAARASLEQLQARSRVHCCLPLLLARQSLPRLQSQPASQITTFSLQAAAGQTLDSIRQQLAAAGHGAAVLRRVKLAEYRGEKLLEASAVLYAQDAVRSWGCRCAGLSACMRAMGACMPVAAAHMTHARRLAVCRRCQPQCGATWKHSQPHPAAQLCWSRRQPPLPSTACRGWPPHWRYAQPFVELL